MLKANPHPDYPPEEGRYVRGNDFSPVAVAIVLNCEAHPFLFNLPMEFIERFRSQVTLVDLQFEGNPGVIRQAV